MLERAKDYSDPEAEAQKIVKEFVGSYNKSDLMNRVYPDKEALRANDIVIEIAQKIIDGELNVPNFDGKTLGYWANFEGEDVNPKTVEGEKQYNKLVSYVSEETGVPVDRINSIGFI